MAQDDNDASFRLNQGTCGIDMLDWMWALFVEMGGRKLRYRDLVLDNYPSLGGGEQLSLG